MNIVESFLADINKNKGVNEFDKEQLLEFIKLFEENKFQQAYEKYWEINPILRDCIPYQFKDMIELEIY